MATHFSLNPRSFMFEQLDFSTLSLTLAHTQRYLLYNYIISRTTAISPGVSPVCRLLAVLDRRAPFLLYHLNVNRSIPAIEARRYIPRAYVSSRSLDNVHMLSLISTRHGNPEIMLLLICVLNNSAAIAHRIIYRSLSQAKSDFVRRARSLNARTRHNFATNWTHQNRGFRVCLRNYEKARRSMWNDKGQLSKTLAIIPCP